jgi:hypothetical protein
MLSLASSLYASAIFNAKTVSTLQLELAYVSEAPESGSNVTLAFHGFVVIHRDGHGFFAANNNDEFFASGNSCV